MTIEIVLAAAGSAATGVATALGVVWKQLLKAQERNEYLSDTLVDLVERDIEAFKELKEAIEKANDFPALNR